MARQYILATPWGAVYVHETNGDEFNVNGAFINATQGATTITGTGAGTITGPTGAGVGKRGVTGTGAGTITGPTGIGAGSYKKKTGGNGGGSTPGTADAGEKYASKFTMPELGTLTALVLESQQTKAVNSRMAIYADNGGVPGARLAVTADKTSVVTGENEYLLPTPYVINAGQVFWIALHVDASINWLLGSSTNGSYKNADTFGDGISNPFGSGTVQNNKAPLLAVYYEGVPPAVIANGTGARTLTGPTGIGTGTRGIVGTGAGTITGLAGSGAGTAENPPAKTGTGAGIITGLVGAGTGTRGVVGTGAGIVAGPTGSGTGLSAEPGITLGVGAGTIPGPTGAGVGRTAYRGSGAGLITGLSGSGAGTAGAAAATGGRRPFAFRSSGDTIKHQRQDLREIWRTDPADLKPVVGMGAGVIGEVRGRGHGVTGAAGSGQAVLAQLFGLGTGTFFDTVAADNEMLMLSSCRPLHERWATRADPDGSTTGTLPEDADVVATMEWQTHFTELV